MKTKVLSIATFIALSSSVFAQIPNNSFENWTSMGSYDNPDNWGTMNNTTTLAGVYTATKATPGNPGNSYLKLTSKTVSGFGVVNGIAVSGQLDSTTMLPKSGFAFNQMPQSFTGKWQHMIYGSSQGSITVTLTRWNTGTNQRETVATASQTLSGMAMSWASFSINFSYVSSNAPDTCVIVLKASGANPTNNDYLWVDDLAFSGSVTGVENHTILNSLNVYPNPSQGKINVDYSFAGKEDVKMFLSDISGKLVKELTFKPSQGLNKFSFETAGIAKGVYFLKISSGNAAEVKKIIIE